ncbi:hypothetical protein STSO111631_06385 [Stackebrandtia soli]
MVLTLRCVSVPVDGACRADFAFRAVRPARSGLDEETVATFVVPLVGALLIPH